MDETLKKIRDLTILIGIYLYFIAWIYIHFYYQQFGISTESVKIDYSSYLMYSYNVLSSSKFLFWVNLVILLVLLRLILLWITSGLQQKSNFIKKTYAVLSNNHITRYIKKINQQYSLLFLMAIQVLIFPLLFKVAREVAIDNYRDDRRHTERLKTIQFIFRKDADIMSPAVALDSTLSPNHVFYNDIGLIKNDEQQLLRLLGESDKYYIVLQQRPFNKQLGALPTGYVYYINKQDVLISKIIHRSL